MEGQSYWKKRRILEENNVKGKRRREKFHLKFPLDNVEPKITAVGIECHLQKIYHISCPELG